MHGSSVSEVAHSSFRSDHDATSPEASTSRTAVAHSDYYSALQEFESLAQKYEGQVGNLKEAELVAFEARLIRLLSRVLISRPPHSRSSPLRPRLTDWLRLIGLSPTNIRHLELCGIHDILVMIQKPRKETNLLADRGRYSPESKKRILRSCDIANSYLEALKGRRESSFTDKQLSWSVYSPVSSKADAWRDTSAESASPPSPRYLLAPVDIQARGDEGRESPGLDSDPCGSFPSTPNMASGHSRSASGSGSLSVLSGRSTLSPSSPMAGSAHSTPTLGSAGRMVQSTSMQLNMKSPKTSRLVHAIPHKWHRSTKYFLRSGDSMCRLCRRPLGFGFLTSWEKCRTCKWKVHSQCKNRIGDTCGLTPEHIRLLFDRLVEQNNGDMWNDPPSASIPSSRSFNEPAFQYPENAAVVDSSSSTNSSAPSTPAFPLNMGSVNSPYNVGAGQSRALERNFTFPDTVPEVPDIVLPETSTDYLLGTVSSTHSSSFVGDGSEGTLVADSTGSTNTDLVNSDESESRSLDNRLERNRWNTMTIRGPNAQASWNEVTIAISEIDFKRNSLVGKGRFGYVLRGYHFGDVAVKFLNMDHVEEVKRLEEFKSDVVAHKNTRHDNIVLFLGYCQENDRFGIVMSLCKGPSLHRAIHESNERLDISVVLQLATQVCQGISYLHTKNIIHKDLRSKNIFIESKNKVVITDFGTFDMKRLAYPMRNNSLLVPSHWLAYLAPELIRALSSDLNDLPFSESSDVYAFSTIWYELLTYSFPWAWEQSDTIIWMVGNGMKAPMHNIKAIREVKELLMRCWSFSGADRPSFSEILTLLINLPRKRLDRSPSFPAMRSYESLF